MGGDHAWVCVECCMHSFCLHATRYLLWAWRWPQWDSHVRLSCTTEVPKEESSTLTRSFLEQFGGRPCLLTPLSTYSLMMLPGIMMTAHMPGYSDETCFPANRPSFQIPAVFTLRRALATRETILEEPWESIVTRVCRSTYGRPPGDGGARRSRVCKLRVDRTKDSLVLASVDRQECKKPIVL
jgi:hypothetical protein